MKVFWQIIKFMIPTFAEKFPASKVPERRTVYSLLGRFHNTGTVDDLPRSGRIGISDNKVMEITDTAAMNPTIGTNRMGQIVAVLQSSVYRVKKTTSTTPSCGGPLRAQIFQKVCFYEQKYDFWPIRRRFYVFVPPNSYYFQT